MLTPHQEVDKLKRRGPMLPGISTRRMGEFLILTVNTKEASFKGRPYSELTLYERKNYEDLLYIAHVQEGNPVITYTA